MLLDGARESSELCRLYVSDALAATSIIISNATINVSSAIMTIIAIIDVFAGHHPCGQCPVAHAVAIIACARRLRETLLGCGLGRHVRCERGLWFGC